MIKSTNHIRGGQNNKLKVLVIALSIMLMLLLIVQIQALLTSHDSKDNVFTMGNVRVTLTEPYWDQDAASAAAPNQIIDKDPTVNNTGANDAYVFVRVEVPIESDTELFTLLNSQDAEGINPGWSLLNSGISGGNKVYTCSFGRTADALTALPPGSSTRPVFNKVKVASLSSYASSTYNLNVTAYAVQTTEVSNVPSEAWELVKGELGVTDPSPVKIVTWADGTDEEIVAMVAAADAGEINLADYWSVGDERQVTLSAMGATGVGESHAEQTVTLVLMHQGGYELADGSTCNFVVGQKNGLAEYGYMNSSNTNDGSWDGSARRAWCNSTYYDAYPAALKPIFKQFKTITAETYNGSTLKTSVDYFALPAEREVFGGAGYGSSGSGYANGTEADCTDIFQFDYYKTEANRIKKLGDSGSVYHWWERSPSSDASGTFCIVSSGGRVSRNDASYSRLLAPFGCI